jgi:hypothetical protein
METKKLLQFPNRTFVIISVITVFTFQAYSAELKKTKTPEKSPAAKPAAPKPAPAKTFKPAPTVSPSSFRPDMPLREAIDILRNSTVPPLNIVVLWKDLEDNADITRDTPIGIDGVTGVPLKTHLSLLLTSLSSAGLAKLGFVVDGGVIIIATRDSLPKKMVTRVYNIADLVAPPSTGGMMQGIGMGGMGMGVGMGMGMMPYGNMMYGNTMSYGTGGTAGAYGNGYPYQGYNYQQQSYNNQQTPFGVSR